MNSRTMVRHKLIERGEGWRMAVRFYFLAGLLVACAALGGSSRADAPSLLLLRPLVVILLGAMLLGRAPIDWRLIRVPLALLAAFAATMAIQLVPMPPSWWLALPGHAPLAPSLVLAGSELTWRPISLDPDLTLNALIALLPALTAMIGYAGVPAQWRPGMLGWVVGAAVASGLVGLVQLVSGEQSAAYLYQPTSRGLPVGLLANRNHQAVLLGLCVPALWLWARQGRLGAPLVRLAVAGGATLLFISLVLMTGSRAGLIATAAALLATPWVAPLCPSSDLGRAQRRLILGGIVASALLIATVVAYITITGQALSIARLTDMDGDMSAQRRAQSLPVLLRMLSDFFPTGLGYGAFEPTFRMYEPDALLAPTYFNRAHDDLLELAMSGGLPTILVMGAALVWLATRMVRLLRRQRDGAPTAALARWGAFAIIGWILASLADYPLRTPFLAVTVVLACLWLEEGAGAPPFERARATSQPEI